MTNEISNQSIKKYYSISDYVYAAPKVIREVAQNLGERIITASPNIENGHHFSWIWARTMKFIEDFYIRSMHGKNLSQIYIPPGPCLFMTSLCDVLAEAILRPISTVEYLLWGFTCLLSGDFKEGTAYISNALLDLTLYAPRAIYLFFSFLYRCWLSYATPEFVTISAQNKIEQINSEEKGPSVLYAFLDKLPDDKESPKIKSQKVLLVHEKYIRYITEDLASTYKLSVSFSSLGNTNYDRVFLEKVNNNNKKSFNSEIIHPTFTERVTRSYQTFINPSEEAIKSLYLESGLTKSEIYAAKKTVRKYSTIDKSLNFAEKTTLAYRAFKHTPEQEEKEYNTDEYCSNIDTKDLWKTKLSPEETMKDAFKNAKTLEDYLRAADLFGEYQKSLESTPKSPSGSNTPNSIRSNDVSLNDLEQTVKPYQMITSPNTVAASPTLLEEGIVI